MREEADKLIWNLILNVDYVRKGNKNDEEN